HRNRMGPPDYCVVADAHPSGPRRQRPPHRVRRDGPQLTSDRLPPRQIQEWTVKKPPPARHITAYMYDERRVRKGVLPVLSGDIVIRRNEVSTFSLTVHGI